jgi:hypothetical protein
MLNGLNWWCVEEEGAVQEKGLLVKLIGRLVRGDGTVDVPLANEIPPLKSSFSFALRFRRDSSRYHQRPVRWSSDEWPDEAGNPR